MKSTNWQARLLVICLCVFTAILLISLVFMAQATSEHPARKPNSLINEQSPYLLQHAYNPVDWMAWGEEAFAKARAENKPLFLSIGYSTCHWCHVMARESFENQDIADILNRYFVSIKIDREERPDIDGIYMAATQLINRHGGWPMSVFVNHDLEPFHAGTYYPPQSRDGRTGFRELLLKINELWETRRKHVDEVAANVTARLQLNNAQRQSQSIDDDVMQQAYNSILATYDEDDGGFGSAPKFPRPGVFSFLIDYAKLNAKSRAREMMDATLSRMSRGGIFDQIGGGYHRYSVDAEWQVPHFEKMLYTQAMMSSACFDLQAFENSNGCLNAAKRTLDFVVRDMMSPSGGFYSAYDADSERFDNPGSHSEGVFYLWTYDELDKLLDDKDLKLLILYYGVRKGGNISSDPFDEFKNMNILYVQDVDYKEIAALTGDSGGKYTRLQKRLDRIHQRLFSERRHRPAPSRDDKIITAWNGLMISAFVKGYQTTGHVLYRDAAIRAAGFIKHNLIDNKSGRLLRQYRAGVARVDAVLDDYVFLVRALLDVYDMSKDKDWLDWATKLTRVQIDRFMDKSDSGFFKSAAGDRHLLFREKEPYDSALPSINAIAVDNLVRLADLHVGQKNGLSKPWRKLAVKTINTFGWHINNNPVACASMLVSYGKVTRDVGQGKRNSGQEH